MSKLIFKHLHANRRRYVWLLLELVLVSIAAWMLLDPAIVSLSSLSIPHGYDRDRLVKISLSKIPGHEAADSDDVAHVERIRALLGTDPRIEASAVVNGLVYESGSLKINGLQNGKEPDDFYYSSIEFKDAPSFFSTFGVVNVSTGVTPMAIPSSPHDVFISKSIADYLFPGEKAVGRYVEEKTLKGYNPGGDNHRIVGVVNDALYRSGMGRTPLVYSCHPDEFKSAQSMALVLRLKPGVDVDDFVADITPGITRRLRSGAVYAHSPKSYDDEGRRFTAKLDKTVFVTCAIAVFFLLNVFLGVTGTFYLQTRNRSEEAGIMRAFGATPRRIAGEMLAEGVLMVTVACLIGFVIYWFACGHTLADASYRDGSSEAVNAVLPLWWDDFNTHFAIISAVIYVIMLVVVTVGIYIPARHISRVNPIDALREE